MNNYSSAYPRRGQVGFVKQFVDKFPSYTTVLPDDPVVAMAYVPFQTDSTTYDELKALKAGTLFPVLDKPFLGSGVR